MGDATFGRGTQFCSARIHSLYPDWQILGQIDLVWRTKWTATKVLYLLSRYLPFFDTPLNLICELEILFGSHFADT